MFVFLLSGEASGGGSGSGGFLEAFKENPLFLSINLATLAICVAVIAERFLFQVSKYKVNSKEFFASVKKLVVAGTSIAR